MNVMQLCFSFQGRISRQTYWVMQFLLWMLTLILLVILNRITIPLRLITIGLSLSESC